MGFVKFIARKAVFPLMSSLNIDRLLLSKAKTSVVNLYFHGVVENDSSYLNPRHITRKSFESMLDFLTRRFDIIPLAQAFEYYQKGICPDKKSLTISFDDGFENNLAVALPSLEKFNAPATFFVSSSIFTDPGYILWADLIDLVRIFSESPNVIVGEYSFKKVGKYGLFSESLDLSAYDFIKGLPSEKRDFVLSEVRNKYNIDNKKTTLPEETWKMMTRDQVRQLDESPIAHVASHGHLHYNLGGIEIDAAKQDILKSKNELEKVLERPVNMLAFPDGSYSGPVIEFCKSIGISQLLAVDYQASSDKQNTSLLNRFSVSNTTTVDSNILRLAKDFDKYGFC